MGKTTAKPDDAPALPTAPLTIVTNGRILREQRRVVSKAIVLAGGPGAPAFDLTDCYPRLAFPMADGRPLLVHLLRALSRTGVTDVAVSLSRTTEGYGAVVDLLEHVEEPGLHVRTYLDNGLCGTAGALKELASFVGDDPFLVFSSNLWIDDLDLNAVFAAHRAGSAAATVLVEDFHPASADLEYVAVDSDGAVEGVRVLHRSHVADQPLRPTGIYVFEPRAIDAIDPVGYADIKEQMLPRLVASGERVQTHRLDHALSRINDVNAYRDLNRTLLHRMVEESGHAAAHYIGGVCIGTNSQVAPGAYILGPVMIGDGCVIGDGAQIIGPTVICDGTHVSSRALVRESFVWRDCRIDERARVSHSVITEACTVGADEVVDNAVVVSGRKYENGFSPRGPRNGHGALPKLATAGRQARQWRRTQRTGYRIAKRSLDIAASLIGLAILVPAFLMVAVAIKLGSRGPVFFRQRRCGLDGRPFRMVKFRTMIPDAEAQKRDLQHHNEAAGPMFKIERDPRVTRVGRFLRKTSLDEMPQLWNVLRGEMSLVGPRPLELDEMSWSPKWRDLRLQVKPGITGLWQINGRNETGFEPWIEHDITYVKNQSLLLDLRILLKTATSLLN